MRLITLGAVYLVGCILFTWWMDRWDMKYRPASPDEKMPWRGMIGGFGLAIASWAWIVLMMWIAGEIILHLFA